MPLKAHYAEVDAGQAGDFWFSAEDQYIVLRLFTGPTQVRDVYWDPEKQQTVEVVREFDEGLCILCLRKPTTEYPGPVWDWDGNREAPTLSPSILHHSQTEWHGYLRAGKLVMA